MLFRSPVTRRSAGQLTAATGMFFGKALIASDIPSLENYVIPGQTGILVPPGDPRALAQAINGFLKEEELVGFMGKNGQALEGEYRRLARNSLVDCLASLFRDRRLEG